MSTDRDDDAGDIDHDALDAEVEAALAKVERVNEALGRLAERVEANPTPTALFKFILASHSATMTSHAALLAVMRRDREALRALAESLDDDEPEWDLGDPM
jgi:hypothetical protein